MIKTKTFSAILICGVLGCNDSIKEQVSWQPDILWVCCEDFTTMLGCYGDKNASTPHLDTFAKQSVLYTNAFSTAPVCSPSRSCIVTGDFAVTLGTQHLRSHSSIPDLIKPFPKYLKEIGYYVTNNYKEDYNFTDTTIWDESSPHAHWKNRQNNQPFFSIFHLGISHQSGIFGSDSVYEARISKFSPFIKRCSPDSLKLPPYYPDTPEVRKLWARYYTNISIIDYQFSLFLEELEKEGLTQNTIVFFFSDHGTGMPRSKRALYDSGLKIPLLIYVPPKYEKKFNINPGTAENRLVSLEDLAPTMLEIIGIKNPDYLPGSSFISKDVIPEKPFVYGTSDRVDEAYEMSRTIRTKKYRYIRNFMPYLALLQPNFYTDQSEIMQELKRYKKVSSLSRAEKTMLTSHRFAEELYDVENDPHQINNLAQIPEYSEVVKEMRKTLKDKILETYDSGLMPEPEMIRLSVGKTPFETAHDTTIYPIGEILQACDLTLKENTLPKEILEKLRHSNGFVRYWAVISIETKGITDPIILDELKKLLNDEFPTVRMESAKILIANGYLKALPSITTYLGSKDYMSLYAARTIQLISSKLPELSDDIHNFYLKVDKETQSGTIDSEYYKLYTYWALKDLFENMK